MKLPALAYLLILAGLVGFVVTSGCAGVAYEKGPVLRYLGTGSRFSVPSPAPAVTPATSSVARVTPGLSPVPDTLPVPSADPMTYQPLRVISGAMQPDEFRTFAFTYRRDDYSVRLPVNISLYHAAKESANKQLIIDDKEISYFYRQMVDDPAMDPVYNDTLRELRKLRYRGGDRLTDDEYLEFLISFVQQIPYDNTRAASRYPVEVLYEQKGDCDEKSILLTGLLAREGYSTGLLVFPAQKHATAGIEIHLVTNNPSFRVFSNGRQDYLYVETTTTRLIGIYPEEYETVPVPIIVPVGNGTLSYGKMPYVASILYDLRTIRTNIQALEEEARAANGTLPQWDYDALVSYAKTYTFVMSTSDRLAAQEAIRESELPHHSACMSCD